MKGNSYSIKLLLVLSVAFPLFLFATPTHKTSDRKETTAPLENANRITPVNSIQYKGKTIKLSDKALYVNAKLADGNLGKYAFKSLQDVAAAAKDGTEQEPTVIYIEPDVYWTDNPTLPNSENKLIGLTFPQANITMIGLSDNPDYTIIAGNRGQMAGAIGNWNTIGIGDGFHAYNITFGNYCNVDLVYTPNPDKNHTKRQETITQAQVITKAHAGEMDKWLFENCKFISFLNVFARSNEPHRAYYKDCFFQCTDDAIGTGDMNVFNNCYFKFYSNHPSGSASNIIQVYLSCTFESVLRDSAANSTIFFAKKNDTFGIIDGVFIGNANRLEWTDNPSDEARHYVYNNSLNGKPALISTTKPELSVYLKGESLQAFKVGKAYNIFNLLRGNDNWDPENQRGRLSQYADLPYRLQVKADKTQLKAETQEKATISYVIYPKRVVGKTGIKWTVSDSSLLSIIVNEDETVTVTGANNSLDTLRGYVKAETPQGIESVAYIEVLPTPLKAPAFDKIVSIKEPEIGKVTIDYSLDSELEDYSVINWYRAKLPKGSDSIQVAVTRLNEPLKTYKLTTGDIGYYLVASVAPKTRSSLTGKPIRVISRKIVESDILSKSIYTDFKNLPVQRTDKIREGFWVVDTHRPEDLSKDFEWEPGRGNGWTYGLGHAGTFDRYGLMTTGRGARLLYAQTGPYKDMSLELALSPHKSAGQGFGSATGQYVDIYIKFDAHTLTGYGLRIQRTPAFGNGVRFTLYKFVNGAGTAISDFIDSSVFVPGCKVLLSVTGNKLNAHVTTSSKQEQDQKDSGLIHEVNLSAIIDNNTFGGFGVQHTGSVASDGNRLMLERILIEYP